MTTTETAFTAEQLIGMEPLVIRGLARDWTPTQIDTLLSELYVAAMTAAARSESNMSTIHRLSGSEVREGWGKYKRTMTDAEARRVLVAKIAACDVKRELKDTDWSGWTGLYAYDADQGRAAMKKLDELNVRIRKIRATEDALDAEYARRPWSRFFLVTSSAGHIHRSMSCHSCTWKTTFGWLPELAGKSDADAVEAHGPALCTHCFPDAPVAWTSAKLTKSGKISKAAR